LYELTGDKQIDFHFYATGIIVLATAINYYSIKVVSAIESYAVIIKLIILLGFVVIGVYGLIGNDNLSQLSFSNWENPIQLLTGGMVIFVAYEGFELIANAAPDMENPKVNIPKAYYYSVIFVIFLYIIIAIVTVGSLPFKEIAEAEDYVLAEAARPMLGQVGFTIITIAALISTFSAINASLYGGSRVSFEVAQDDELPHELTSQLWNQPVGLMITAVLTLLITNVLALESISIAGSIGFLLIFTIVNLIGYKKSSQINSRLSITITGTIFCAVATITLIVQQFNTNMTGVLIAVSIITACFVFEWIFKKSKKGKSKLKKSDESSL
jgi:amino acid transporter